MMFETFKKYFYGHLDNQKVSNEANGLLQNEAFIIAYESLQDKILEDFMDSKPEDTARREFLYQQYRALEDLKFELNRLVIKQSSQPEDLELNQGGK